MFVATLLVASALVRPTLSPVVSDVHEGVYFKAPAGWKSTTDDGVRTLVPTGLKDGEILAIVISAAEKSPSETPAKQLESLANEINADCTIIAKGEIGELKRTSGTVVIQAVAVEQEALGAHSRLIGLILEDGKRALVLILAKPDSLLEKHQTAITEFLSSLSLKAPSKIATPANPSSKIPYGETPSEYMGSVGWRPSGRGVPLPLNASFVDGKPHGVWYGTGTDSNMNFVPTVYIYLSDGTRATHPRLGGPTLYDIEGHKAQPGFTGVGRYTISNGVMTEEFDGMRTSGEYKMGKNDNGIFFYVGQKIIRPVVPLTKTNILGKWTSRGSQFEFLADGTYKSGQVLDTGDWVVGSMTSGRYTIEGFILMLEPNGSPIQLDRAGLGGPMLIKGARFYTKK
ncbi:hypothetical protein QPK87_31355 [Kamptonema cortianum]|nr:hypothetical protein [Geitlerinema splendidum]MDK3161022.1 hypothetical protein [Kamptonema cortianum]